MYVQWLRLQPLHKLSLSNIRKKYGYFCCYSASLNTPAIAAMPESVPTDCSIVLEFDILFQQDGQFGGGYGFALGQVVRADGGG